MAWGRLEAGEAAPAAGLQPGSQEVQVSDGAREVYGGQLPRAPRWSRDDGDPPQGFSRDAVKPVFEREQPAMMQKTGEGSGQTAARGASRSCCRSPQSR